MNIGKSFIHIESFILITLSILLVVVSLSWCYSSYTYLENAKKRSKEIKAHIEKRSKEIKAINEAHLENMKKWEKTNIGNKDMIKD